MVRKIGKELSIAVKRRFDQIKSFSNFYNYVMAHIDNTESLSGDLKGYYSMTLNRNYRIVVSPEVEDTSFENLKNVFDFKVIGVIDYHGTGNKKSKWIIS